MKETLHRAGWVMADPDTWVENGVVTILGNRIVSVGRADTRTDAMDHGPGVIMPALGNAHTHLSLSALKDQVDTKNGFISWTKELIRIRESISDDDAESVCLAEAAVIKASGVGFAAESGPLMPGAKGLKKNGIKGLAFFECLGPGTDCPALPEDMKGLIFSWAGHAAHTTSPDLLNALKRAATGIGRPFGIHLAESEAEVEFLTTGNGEWFELMNGRGHDCSQWRPWGERPVERAYRLGLLDPQTLAVHLLEVTPPEVEILVRTGTKVCVCPRSNLALHGKLPDLEGFLQKGLNPAIGTDSLASVSSLSMFDEMRFIAANYPGLRPETIIGLATTNSADALGFHDLGSLSPAGPAHMIYVDLEAKSRQEAAQKLVSRGDLQVKWLDL